MHGGTVRKVTGCSKGKGARCTSRARQEFWGGHGLLAGRRHLDSFWRMPSNTKGWQSCALFMGDARSIRMFLRMPQSRIAVGSAVSTSSEQSIFDGDESRTLERHSFVSRGTGGRIRNDWDSATAKISTRCAQDAGGDGSRAQAVTSHRLRSIPIGITDTRLRSKHKVYRSEDESNGTNRITIHPFVESGLTAKAS